MDIKKDTLTNSGMILIIKNNADQTYHYGPQYSLEKYENGEFITYKPKETLTWNSILFNIKVGEEKLIYSSNVAEKFYVEFEIK